MEGLTTFCHPSHAVFTLFCTILFPNFEQYIKVFITVGPFWLGFKLFEFVAVLVNVREIFIIACHVLI